MDELESKVREALNAFWDEREIPAGPSGATTVDELLEPVESMTAVEVLVTLDAIVGHKLPNTVIQAGGYSTKSEFVDKLTASVLAYLQTKS